LEQINFLRLERGKVKTIKEFRKSMKEIGFDEEEKP
jgi:hypothetical protein